MGELVMKNRKRLLKTVGLLTAATVMTVLNRGRGCYRSFRGRSIRKCYENQFEGYV